MPAAEKLATWEDLLADPRPGITELIKGALYNQPSPSVDHQCASDGLGEEIGGPFWRRKGGPGGWIILSTPQLRLGDDAPITDLAGWRRERMPQRPHGASIDLAPDWVCEILSTDRQHDRLRKMPLYAQHGIPHLWLVDPEVRSLEVFELHNYRYQCLEGVEARLVPFDAIAFDLSTLWLD